MHNERLVDRTKLEIQKLKIVMFRENLEGRGGVYRSLQESQEQCYSDDTLSQFSFVVNKGTDDSRGWKCLPGLIESSRTIKGK